MARKKRCKVFVSYSRHDEALVKPLAQLLGAAADDAIFLDIESIRPGDLWKSEIQHAVRASSVFILCWCCQSERSEFVQHEIAMALEGEEKRVVPVLFCSTPLPKLLKTRQWVDLRGRIVHSCSQHDYQHDFKIEDDSVWAFPRNEGNLRPSQISVSRPARWPLIALFLLGFSLVSITTRPDSHSGIALVGLIAGVFATSALIGLYQWWHAAQLRNQHQEAKKVVAIATKYFENLGQTRL